MKLKLDTVIINPKTGQPHTETELATKITNIVQVHGKLGSPKSEVISSVAALVSNPDDYPPEELTLGGCMYNALTGQMQGDEKLASTVRRKRGGLAFDVLNAMHSGKELDIDSKDASMVQDLVERSYSPAISFQVCELLDGRKLPTIAKAKDPETK